MADPFQDVDAAGAEFIGIFADAMDVRQADPTMEAIVAGYLEQLDLSRGSLTVEVGSGAGAVSRRVAAASRGRVIGFEPSAGFVAEARKRVRGLENLTFEVADGADLPLQEGTADHLILHTVLTHVTDPGSLLTEAARVLKPGGRLVVCDADFSKATLSNAANDPLDVCAREFVDHFVTDPFIVAKLRELVRAAGLSVTHFDVTSRVVTEVAQMLPWVEMTTRGMVDRGEIGAGLREALIAEYHRRGDAGTLYGYQVLATVIADK